MSPEDQPTLPIKPPDGSRSAAPGMWQAPSVEQMQELLPQYEIMEILGRGGMGAVYKGRQKSLKRLVAIKILPPDAADDEMKFVERFQNEAQTMAAMNHPAIVAVYDFGETKDGLLYFIMEYVDGTDVQKMIQASGKLSGEYALAITAHVCDALAYAHSRGVIHRDIKPANIFINQEGHVKVGDFGLAKMDDPSATSGLTRTNMAMGTPDYVAPEVLSPGMVADHRADIYAVGVMLYQMLTGEVPRGMFKLPSQKGIGSDPRFDEIICKAMEQNRDERYQTAGDVRRALDVILTTPQPKNDGTGVVPAKEIPQKPVAKGPRPPGNADTPVRTQQPPPQHGAMKATADKSVRSTPAAAAAPKAKAPPKKQSPAAMWMSIGGIVAVLGIAGFFIFASKPKPVADLTDASTASQPTQPQAPIKVRENPPSKPVSSPSSAKGKTIDLLSLVDLKRDEFEGEWTRTAEGIAKQGAASISGNAPRVRLPYEPPQEYDIEFEFTPGKGTQSVGLFLTAESRYFSWILGGGKGDAAGFELFDSKPTSVPNELSTTLGQPVEAGHRYRSRVEVRAGTLRGYLDDKKLIDWDGRGKFTLLGTSVAVFKKEAHLGLRAARDVVFHKITVREITGAGKVDAPQAVASPAGYPAGITNWQDVTSTMREKLSSKQGFTVGPEGIALSGEGETVYTPLLEGGVGDRAVRVRYIGQTQISLWFAGGGGSAFVLAQRDRVMFKRQRQKDGEADTLLPSVIHPAGFDATQPHELLVAVLGATVRVWLDGRFIGEAEEAPFQQSALMLVPIKESTVQKVEVATMVVSHASVTGGKGDDPQNNNRTSPEWTDWLGPKLASGQSLPGGWKVDGSGVTTERPMGGANVIQQEVKDAAVRVSYDLRDSQGIQITMRESKAGGSRDMYFADDTGDTLYIARLEGTTVKSLTRRDYPAGTPRSGTRTLEFRCVGDRLEATVTGAASEPITLTATDAALVSGPCAVVLKKNALLKKVEIADLTPSAASPELPPANLKWRDVTADAREKAKTTPGLAVDEQGIRKAGAGTNPHLMLTPPGQRDQAVLVRYTGEAQIDLRYGARGFIYVLAQVNQTIIQSHAPDAPTPVILSPNKPHPPDFDPARPHELLVTLEGKRLRVWLDGRFVAEAKADTFTEGATALLFVPKTVVHKVEIAELATAALSREGTEATWQPIFNQAADFGGDMRDDVEFRDGATFIKARTFLAPADPGIVGIRSTMRYMAGGDRTGSLTLRSTEPVKKYGEEDFGLTAFIAPKGTSFVVKMRDRPAGISELGRHDFPLTPALKEGEPFTFELRAEGKKITAIINGREVGSLDDKWTGAPRRFGITPSVKEMTEFRDVAVYRGAAKVP